MRNPIPLLTASVLAISLVPAVANAAPCEAPAAWFPHAQTPPPNSAGFPAAPNNCDFHQWSWQAFLWLTQTVAGGVLRFDAMPGPDALNGKPGNTAALSPFTRLSQQLGKPIDEFLQAGPDGILVDQKGRVVYYSIYINDTFLEFTTKNGLSDPATLAAFDPNTAFPVDTLTLKAAWKIVQPGEDTSRFYTRKATVNKLINQNGKITLGPDTEDTTVALVGFHIAGTVQNHPEMIWASFEHVDNAPDLSVEVAKAQPNDIVSPKDWTFYKAGTPFKNCNINAAGAQILKLDAATQILSPSTEVCRVYPYGSGPDKADNANNIKSINASAQAQVDGVWKNYFEVGAIWFNANNALKPNCSFLPGSLQCGTNGQSLLTGSTHLSNAVIETFTQTQSAQDNCFACHNTLQETATSPALKALPGKNVNISHVLVKHYFQAQQTISPK